MVVVVVVVVSTYQLFMCSDLVNISAGRRHPDRPQPSVFFTKPFTVIRTYFRPG